MAERRWTTADFDYPLPDHLIAQVPPAERGSSRLLVVDPVAGTLDDTDFPALATLIPAGDLLVLNSTRVRHARLLGTRPSGRPAEVLLVHPLGDDRWLAMGKPGKALQPGRRIALGGGIEVETVAVREDGFREVRFVGGDAATAIARYGHLPLPPYITREADAHDERRYQTVYAEREGSVAAPTAGLHFTEAFLRRLADTGVEVATLDLEVGPGTFRPVETDDPGAHPMHAERFEIPAAAADAIASARARGARVWAVGTTVVRALESAATDKGTVAAGGAETRLMILPGHRYRVVDRLLTNFHLPRSTLLMLVAAFAGYEMTLRAYRHAVDGGYRFYSYGDAMCIVTRFP